MSRALIAALILGMAVTAHAQLIDRVVAFVDDEVILLSELRERAEPALASGSDLEPLALYRQTLSWMIEAKLLEREARRLSVVVTDDDVRRAMANVAAQNGMDDQELRGAILEQGFTLPLYEQVLREQLLRMKVVQLHASREAPITDEVVRAEWERRAAAFEGGRRYRVAELSAPASRDPAARRAARERLEERIARLRSGNATPSEVGAVEPGWVLASELSPAVVTLLEDLEPGELSPIQEMGRGFVALQLLEVGEAQLGSFESMEATIRQELYAARSQTIEARLFEELRAEASIAQRL